MMKSIVQCESTAIRPKRSDILAFQLADSAVTPEGFTLVFQAQERPPGTATESVRQHFCSVAKHKSRALPDGAREMGHLHPAFFAPAQEFNLLRLQFLGA